MDPISDIDAAIDAVPSDQPQDAPEPSPVASAPAPTPAAAAPEPTAPAPVPAATPAKPAADDEDIALLKPKPAATTPAKPAAVAAPAKPAATATEPTSLKEFRQVYENTKKERDEIAAERDRLRTEAAEARKAGEKEAETRIRAEMDVLSKEKQELDSRIRFLDYSKSPEFEAKHEKPLKDAWRSALEDLQGAKIVNDDGTETDANYGHVQALMRMSPIEAAKTATKWFGAAGPEIMRHRNAILTLQKEKAQAIDHWKAKGEELTQQRQRETAEFNGNLQTMFTEERDSFPTNYPDLFAHDPKNPEETTLFQKNRALTELAARGKGIPEGTDERQRAELMVKAQARMVARAEAFGFTRLRLNKALDEIETLKKKVAEFEGSVPGEGKTVPPAASGSTDDSDSWEKRVDAIPGVR
jgi:hypothetical protein